MATRSDKLSSTQQRWLAAICIVTALGLFLWSRVSRLNEEPLALETPRGTDFKVQDVPVRAVLVVAPIRVNLGTTINSQLQLQNIADAPVLGNEMNGTLTAGLSAVGCQVAPISPMTYSTTAQVAQMYWAWSVSDCTEGRKVLSASLTFHPNDPANTDSDPDVYQGDQHILVTKGFSVNDVKDWASTIATIIATIASLKAFWPSNAPRVRSSSSVDSGNS
jgi:hypothetical protein